MANLNDRCLDHIACFNGDNTNIFQDTMSFLDMIVSEVIENIPIPGIILAFLTIFGCNLF